LFLWSAGFWRNEGATRIDEKTKGLLKEGFVS
jgi:hypothetical protein